MTTLTKIIVATLMSLTLFSCNFDMHFNPGVRGNGNVQTETRNINESFSSIHVSRGLDVYLTQSNDQIIEVEADENLLDIIVVEVENDELKITTTDNIAYSKAQKVMVSFKDVSKITSTSGSDVFSTNIITATAGFGARSGAAAWTFPRSARVRWWSTSGAPTPRTSSGEASWSASCKTIRHPKRPRRRSRRPST